MVRSACGGGGMTAMAILMCKPEFFGIEYEINPWMHVAVKVDHALAEEQWATLHATYLEQGLSIELAEPVKGQPDMVFTANAAVVWNGKAVLSNFRHDERHGEEEHCDRELRRLGFDVHRIDHQIAFEGAGDALFVGETLFCGHGFRTDLAAHAPAGDILGVEVVSLRLADPRFYHLDTCFCPLDGRTALFAPEAFDAESVELVRRRVPRAIEVSTDVAAGFACNAMPLDGVVISSLASRQLESTLKDAGFATVGLPMGEFMKSGGGVRCLTLPLDLGRH